MSGLHRERKGKGCHEATQKTKTTNLGICASFPETNLARGYPDIPG